MWPHAKDVVSELFNRYWLKYPGQLCEPALLLRALRVICACNAREFLPILKERMITQKERENLANHVSISQETIAVDGLRLFLIENFERGIQDEPAPQAE